MSSRKFTYTIVIGRFQPLHVGHHGLIKTALELGDNVIILAGSSNKAISVKNPFTVDERVQMINLQFFDDKHRIKVVGLPDYDYNDQKWVIEVQSIVNNIVYSNYLYQNPSVCLVGHDKDESTYYLKMFPNFNYHECKKSVDICATKVRNLIFFNGMYEKIDAAVGKPVGNYIRSILTSNDRLDNLCDEYTQILSYKSNWSLAPYPPTFITTDTVVVESGHILLVKRGRFPGKGQWALPGGFLNQDESLEDCAIRELLEETKIKVKYEILKNSIKKTKVFDKPDRDPRGRFITHAFLIELKSNYVLSEIEGGDDAIEAKWFQLSNLKELNIFLDHRDIIENMIGSI